MLAILLECGIIVNRQEEQKLTELKYQKKLVSSLTEAIDKLCNMVNSGVNLNINRSILRLFTKVGCLYMFKLKNCCKQVIGC